MEILEEEYGLRQVITGVIAMVSVKADEKGLALETDISKDLPKELWGDDKRIKEIMLNLLNNSVKYTEKGTVTFSVSSEKEADDIIRLIIKVRDTGIGMDKEPFDTSFSEAHYSGNGLVHSLAPLRRLCVRRLVRPRYRSWHVRVLLRERPDERESPFPDSDERHLFDGKRYKRPRQQRVENGHEFQLLSDAYQKSDVYQ